MNPSGGRLSVSAEHVPRHLVGFGALLVLAPVVETVWLARIGSAVVGHPAFLIGLFGSVPFAVFVAAGGAWLARSSLEAERYPRVAGWCAASFVLFVSFNVAFVSVLPDVAWTVIVGWVRWAASLGAGVGVLIGVVEARGIERAVIAERSALRTEHVETQRDLLEYLNGILRHEVLNAAAIIHGYATNILEESEELDEEHRRWIEIVVAETDDMTTVIDDVRALLHATRGEVRLRRVELSAVLRAEVDRLRGTYESVDVDLSAPESVDVWADDLLPRVFWNLLSNAVEHNDADAPRVSVTVATDDDRVRVAVADDGPGVPEGKRDALFERSEASGSRHGLGLYLVGQLVDRYGGSIELAETGPDGSRFEIELPRADGSAEEPPTGETIATPGATAPSTVVE